MNLRIRLYLLILFLENVQRPFGKNIFEAMVGCNNVTSVKSDGEWATIRNAHEYILACGMRNGNIGVVRPIIQQLTQSLLPAYVLPTEGFSSTS